MSDAASTNVVETKKIGYAVKSCLYANCGHFHSKTTLAITTGTYQYHTQVIITCPYAPRLDEGMR